MDFVLQDRFIDKYMKKILLEALHSIPPGSADATIQGVRMQLITITDKERLLAEDPADTVYHECTLKNGTFVFVTNAEHRLTTLYKVIETDDH